jgi:hypothetical protein
MAARNPHKNHSRGPSLLQPSPDAERVSQAFKALMYLSTVNLRQVMPNPSFEARPNIKMPGPQSELAHFPPSGPGISLPVPPQLER